MPVGQRWASWCWEWGFGAEVVTPGILARRSLEGAVSVRRPIKSRDADGPMNNALIINENEYDQVS